MNNKYFSAEELSFIHEKQFFGNLSQFTLTSIRKHTLIYYINYGEPTYNAICQSVPHNMLVSHHYITHDKD